MHIGRMSSISIIDHDCDLHILPTYIQRTYVHPNESSRGHKKCLLLCHVMRVRGGEKEGGWSRIMMNHRKTHFGRRGHTCQTINI